MPLRDIHAVLRDHEKDLMSIPGVVGVGVALGVDGQTLCLRVVAASKTPALEQKVPQSLEGHPVEVWETGVFRPIRPPNQD